MIKNPSNSKIQVLNYPLLEGSFEGVKERCIREIQKLISTGRNFVIGHSSLKRARPRFKDYEKHRGLDVNEIFLIFRCFSKVDAHRMEGFLIDLFKANPNNRNIRSERNIKDKVNNDEYFVYLACQ